MRIAIDTGGTLTDCVYPQDGKPKVVKVVSTPSDPGQPAVEALRRTGHTATFWCGMVLSNLYVRRKARVRSGRWSSKDHRTSMAKTILVVDDSVTMVMSLKTTLSLHGFHPETAGNGKEALDRLRAGLKPDLIVTDINMPVMGGMELIRNVRAMAGLKFIPILTLTTESELAKRNEGKLAGATGWIVKPVSGNDLVAVIRKVLPGA